MSKDFTVPFILSDAMLSGAQQTTNYSNYTYIMAGESNGSTAIYRNIIAPNFSNLPSGITFIGSRLFVTPVTNASDNARTMYLKRILKNVVQTQATWLIYSTGNNWDSAGCSDDSSDYDGDTVIGSVEVPAKPTNGVPIEMTLSPSELQKLYDGTYANNGFILFKDVQVNDLTYFASMENSTVAYRPYFEIDFSVPFTSQYPPAHNDTYVKATTTFNSSYSPYYTTDPSKSLIGNQANNGWMTPSGTTTNQRFHIDLGEAKIIKNIYYENYHNISPVESDRGVKDFTFWGSNEASAFAELTYGTDTDWTQLTTSASAFLEHANLDLPHPEFIGVTNTTAYRYYAFKFANNYGDGSYMGVRRIELQTEDAPVITSFYPRIIFY